MVFRRRRHLFASFLAFRPVAGVVEEGEVVVKLVVKLVVKVVQLREQEPSVAAGQMT